jgi:hypothetical protein
MPVPTDLESRLAALSNQITLLRQAIRSLERGVACHKPIPLHRPENAALSALVQGTVDEPSEPFVRVPSKQVFPREGREVE